MYRLSCNDYRVAKLSNSYLTVIGIIMQSLNLKENSNMYKLIKNGRTDHFNYRKLRF